MSNIVTTLLALSRGTKRALQIVADAGLVILCFVLAMLLRLESWAFVADADVWLAILLVVPVTIAAFRQLGLYRSILRFITGQAFGAIGAGVLISACALFLATQLLDAPVPRSVPGIYAVLLIISAGGLRFWLRRILSQPMLANRKPIAIYGAGEAGRQLQNALQHGQEYAPLVFIDDDPALQHTLVGGRRVYAASELPRLIGELQIKTILMAVPGISRAQRREIIAGLEPLGLEIKTIPSMADIVSGRATFDELQRVTPEDLLGRDPVPPNDALMGRNITGKNVLVTGAGGSIGSELCRQIIRYNPKSLILLDVSEFALYTISTELHEKLDRSGNPLRIEPVLGSVQNHWRMRAVLRAFGVQTIYHAAAYKHVVLVEENVVEGVRNNVFGTKVMAEAAVELGVENFILISTDKAVRPTNFMGASKRMAELVCQGLAQRQNRTVFSMVRFGNVLGSSGSVIPRFKAQIERGGPVTVTHREITRYFMTIPEASQLVIQAGAMAKGGDVFVLDMGDPVKILDLAQSMIRLHGLRPYVLGDGAEPDPAKGDMPIRIVGLNKGEKLYEELLIGNDPQGTEHPRIMTAREIALSEHELENLLENLQRACLAFDIAQIRRIFTVATLGYQPTTEILYDRIWNSIPERETIRPFKAVGGPAE